MASSALLALLLAAGAFAAPVETVPAAQAPISAPVPAVAGISWAGDNGYAGLRRLPELGRGEFGVVYDHPSDPTAVVKLSADNPDSALRALFGSRPRELNEVLATEEAESTRRLAEIGAGPRLLYAARVPHRFHRALRALASLAGMRAPDWSRPALVKEKVFGETVLDLRRRQAFGPEEERLVAELHERLNRGGVAEADAADRNLMIGTTASHPQRQAWLVDAGFAVWTPKP